MMDYEEHSKIMREQIGLEPSSKEVWEKEKKIYS